MSSFWPLTSHCSHYHDGAQVLLEGLSHVLELHPLQLDPAGLLCERLNDDSGPQIPGSQHLLAFGIQTVQQITWNTEWSPGDLEQWNMRLAKPLSLEGACSTVEFHLYFFHITIFLLWFPSHNLYYYSVGTSGSTACAVDTGHLVMWNNLRMKKKSSPELILYYSC